MSPTELRAEFPIFAARPRPFHYLDSAATGQICRAAAEALLCFETTARANVKRGVYRLADEATQAFDRARAEIAAYLGVRDARGPAASHLRDAGIERRQGQQGALQLRIERRRRRVRNSKMIAKRCRSEWCCRS